MKMKLEHYAHIQCALAAHDTPAARQAYAAAGLSTTRYQWDMLRKAGLLSFLCRELYEYLNDSHVQTALNKLIPSL